MRSKIALPFVAAMLVPVATSAQVAPPHPAGAMLLDGTLLEVAAEGRTARRPDLVAINTGVVTQAPTAAEALAQNAAQVKRVVAALKAAGIADRDIRSADISLQPQYRYGENQPPIITGYQASNRIAVRFRDIARAGAILDALVREGANQIDGPNFMLEQPEAALDEARTDAIAKARARAELYARAAGLRVERILSISESPVGPGPIPMIAMRANMADQAETKLMPGEQDVNVTLSVRFLLK